MRGKFKRANLSTDLTWCNAITVLKDVNQTFEVDTRLMEIDLVISEDVLRTGSQYFCKAFVLYINFYVAFCEERGVHNSV